MAHVLALFFNRFTHVHLMVVSASFHVFFMLIFTTDIPQIFDFVLYIISNFDNWGIQSPRVLRGGYMLEKQCVNQKPRKSNLCQALHVTILSHSARHKFEHIIPKIGARNLKCSNN